MKKLFLLLFLLPVLSWADCVGNLTHCEYHRCIDAGRDDANCMCENHGGLEFEGLPSQHPVLKYNKNITPGIVLRKCYAFKSPNLTGNIETIGPDANSGYCSQWAAGDIKTIGRDGKTIIFPANEWFEHYCKKLQPKTLTNTPTPTVSFEDAKKQCEDIGFKPKTERFGECVLELNR